MKFINNIVPSYDLTYNDVFLVPNFSNVGSRFNVDLNTPDDIGTHIPIVVSNMSAVAGKRMAETVARRGGLTVLPQDIPFDRLASMIKQIKSADILFETPLTLKVHNTIADVLNLINKRSHGVVLIVDDFNVPIGLVTEKEAINLDRFSNLEAFANQTIITVDSKLSSKDIYQQLFDNHINSAPVVDDNGKLIGIITQKSALRANLYSPAIDNNNNLKVAVALGVNGDVKVKAEKILSFGADLLVIDTAHGHQQKMIDAIKAIRSISQTIKIVAGNVVTAEGTNALIDAGANIIKVGVGPGAMCITRMMTGVGRPQFSAILECSTIARSRGASVWADGGIKYPRDVALALAAGASSVMIGTWFSGTYESAGDVLRDDVGLYKENFGMASKRAVINRTHDSDAYERSLKEFFEEGISNSKLYIDEKTPGVEDIIDLITSGLRSSMSYAGATNINDFYEKAIIGIQSAAGYEEGKAVRTSW